VADAARRNQLKVLLSSEVKAIREDAVLLQQGALNVQIPNDTVIVSAGGILPNDFLRSIGINVETKFGTELGVSATPRKRGPNRAATAAGDAAAGVPVAAKYKSA
jgi:NADH dehydrogenase FAD-containing subunit